jgi:hypothetical protein
MNDHHIYRVTFEQVDQDYVEVKAQTPQEAEQKAWRKWRKTLRGLAFWKLER